MIYNVTETGERIDRFLSDNAGLTRTAVAKLIEAGNCKINGVVKTAKNHKLKAGDEVSLTIPEAVEIGIIPEEMPIEIIYEDDDLLVVNKPRGIVVHPAHGNESGTLVNFLMYHCGDSLSGINGEIRPGIVHRIDKNTSGLLLAAKNDFSHTRLAEQLKAREVIRGYQAVVSGFIRESGTVNVPIGRHKIKRKEMTVNGLNPREAITRYEVVKNYENASHLRICLETGRTHQIRVHMAYIGHPVLGDDVYCNGKSKAFVRYKRLGGQCLHACKLGLIHPRTGEYMEFECGLPEYFTKLLGQLRET
ncbi:MAG: RluA family pseudouridine synthase [Oscillospiraceae bacterium]|jgi:23S rRNA pseudouridine1911/1915/1917 synthase|nr:RluA family pseudouridine synthase [Oscillospiraceae bacterium]